MGHNPTRKGVYMEYITSIRKHAELFCKVNGYDHQALSLIDEIKTNSSITDLYEIDGLTLFITYDMDTDQSVVSNIQRLSS